jgi:hypothetical protein
MAIAMEQLVNSHSSTRRHCITVASQLITKADLGVPLHSTMMWTRSGEIVQVIFVQ